MVKTDDLSKLPNIGKILAEKLVEIGINSIDDFSKVSTEAIFLRLRMIDSTACRLKLYAIEGAKRGIRWHSLDEITKSELNSFFNSL